MGDTPDFDVTNFPEIGDLAYIEYSVVDLLQGGSAGGPRAANTRDQAKANKYRNLGVSTNHAIFPASQDTTGRLSDGFRKILQICDSKNDKEQFDEAMAGKLTWACVGFRQFHVQRIAISFWNGVSRMENNRARINAFRSTGRYPAARRDAGYRSVVARPGWAAARSFP